MARELTTAQLAEHSIIKKYRKDIWNPFIAAMQRYNLIKEGDKIAVCISGGKDSMLMAKLMQHYMDLGIDVPVRVDHVPTLASENSQFAGYDALGRYFAIGYLKGILDGIK